MVLHGVVFARLAQAVRQDRSCWFANDLHYVKTSLLCSFPHQLPLGRSECQWHTDHCFHRISIYGSGVVNCNV